MEDMCVDVVGILETWNTRNYISGIIPIPCDRSKESYT